MSKRIKFFSLAVLFVFFLLLSVSSVFAQGNFRLPDPEPITPERAYGSILIIGCWLIRMVIIGMVVFVILSGVKFLMSAGNPEGIASAKKNFWWGLVGILIILATNVIIGTIYAFIIDDDRYIFYGLVCP